jgi:hypothetical protein
MAVFGLLGDDSQTGDDKKGKFLGLEEKTVRNIGIGLLVTGVALGGYAVYKNASKKKSGKLSGVKRRKRVKKGGRRMSKRTTVVKRINF